MDTLHKTMYSDAIAHLQKQADLFGIMTWWWCNHHNCSYCQYMASEVHKPRAITNVVHCPCISHNNSFKTWKRLIPFYCALNVWKQEEFLLKHFLQCSFAQGAKHVAYALLKNIFNVEILILIKFSITISSITSVALAIPQLSSSQSTACRLSSLKWYNLQRWIWDVGCCLLLCPEWTLFIATKTFLSYLYKNKKVTY